MKKLFALVAAAGCMALGSPALHAAGAQQSLMGTCNKEAQGKKGDERKAFMKNCLSDGKKRQQEVMKSCNAGASGKKGEERKQFMSQCLKK